MTIRNVVKRWFNLAEPVDSGTAVLNQNGELYIFQGIKIMQMIRDSLENSGQIIFNYQLEPEMPWEYMDEPLPMIAVEALPQLTINKKYIVRSNDEDEDREARKWAESSEEREEREAREAREWGKYYDKYSNSGEDND